jgi:FMN phosphatase YigB (HAD superfamily)
MKYRAVLWDIDGTLYGMNPGGMKEIRIQRRMEVADWVPDERPEFLTPYDGLAELMAQIPSERQGIITNGSGKLQRGKLSLMGLDQYVNPELIFASYEQAEKVLEDPEHPLLKGFTNRESHQKDVVAVGMKTQKPKRYMFERALEVLGLDAEDCVMVGDDWKDIVGAQEVGMNTIYIEGLRRPGPVEKGDVVPDFTVEKGDIASLTELLI